MIPVSSLSKIIDMAFQGRRATFILWTCPAENDYVSFPFPQ